MNIDGSKITQVRFWTSRTGILFANVTLLNSETGELITRHPNREASAKLYAGIVELLSDAE